MSPEQFATELSEGVASGAIRAAVTYDGIIPVPHLCTVLASPLCIVSDVVTGDIGFTSYADEEVVAGLYEQAFLRAFATFRQFDSESL